MGEDILDRAWTLLIAPDWKEEKRLESTGDVVYSKVVKGKKLFKVHVSLDSRGENLILANKNMRSSLPPNFCTGHGGRPGQVPPGGALLRHRDRSGVEPSAGRVQDGAGGGQPHRRQLPSVGGGGGRGHLHAGLCQPAPLGHEDGGRRGDRLHHVGGVGQAPGHAAATKESQVRVRKSYRVEGSRVSLSTNPSIVNCNRMTHFLRGKGL